jgi:CMP-N,N'-diacetyllegionaminic acid synthase
MGVLSAMREAMKPRLIALVPARAGSKRLPGKNLRELNGHPLIAYAIAAAQESGLFAEIVVSTDDDATGIVAENYGALYCHRRLSEATDDSPDIEWVNHAWTDTHDAFMILRPTSPFRRGPWLRAAWEYFLEHQPADSLRAMRLSREHPGKMWRPGPRTVTPLLPFSGNLAPWHSMPTQQLPPCYVQTAALEIAWTSVLPESISGETVLPWVTEPYAPECCDINTADDWEGAIKMAAEHPDWLPIPRKEPAC